MELDFKEIAKKINKAAKDAGNTAHNSEARLRELVTPLWQEYLKSQQIDFNFVARDELILANGTPDTVFNRLILEYKKPGIIKPSNAKNRVVITKVQGYIEDLAAKEGWKQERLLGVAFDGVYFLFIRKIRRWIIEEPIPVNERSVERFFLTLKSLTGKTALIPEFLIRDFAVGTSSTGIATRAIKAFYFALTNNVHPKVKVFFDQWAVQFAEVHGSIEEKKFDDKVLFQSYGFNEEEQEGFKHLAFFFALDTYYALLMKLLAYQVVGYYVRIGFGRLPLIEWELLNTNELKAKLAQVEEGGVFQDLLRIRNFLEGDLLSWYLNDWNSDIEEAIKEIIKRLNGYDPQTMELLPDETRDILKKLYQFLVPKKIRHDLGEYYTPDWLAERCLDQIGYGVNDKELLKKRVLDPGCGSGTFLILAIKRAKENALRRGKEAEETLEAITKNIVGFDLNPLAVISARTNYLLAVADLLRDHPGSITIPVYLCDSIKPPEARIAGEMTLFPKKEPYEIKTTVGKFYFSHSIIDKQRIQQLTNLLEDGVKQRKKPIDFVDDVKTQLDLTDEEFKDSELFLLETFDKLMELDEKGINGIWSRIIKNGFAPLFVGNFDCVIGNPPWVNWESLPEEYRNETKPLWEKYGLFSLSGHEARLGGGKKDISMLMTYVSIDKYLKPRGKLCFVITQTVFKTQGAGDGFRKFQLGEKGSCFRIDHLDDMVDLQPFEGATNRTSVVLCTKGETTKYPLPYTMWKKVEKRKIDLDFTLEEITQATNRLHFKAQPIGISETSPWFSARPKALAAILKAIGKSDYQAYEGANSGGMNSVYWIRILKNDHNLILIENLFKIGKKEVKSIQMEIEPDLVYPLLRGRDVSQWSAKTLAYIIVTQNPKTRSGFEESWMKETLPRTYLYFKQFEDELWTRQSSSVRKLMENGTFYSMFAVSDSTFAPYKVVWKEQSSEFECAVISTSNDKVVVPDHKLMLVPFENETEAHYVCAILNSSISGFIVQSYTIATQQSTHILENIKVQKFDPNNGIHLDLARLSKSCHEKVALGIAVSDIEEQIDELSAEIWGLTKEELKDIKESLAEIK
ncbi:MAG: N-6 DNA methylase [Bacteroidota bacterium]